MHALVENIIVMGHANPDMDASAAAVCYAEFLNRLGRYDQLAIGAVPSDVTPQAKYVFQRAGVPPPDIISDVSPRVGHVMRRDICAVPGQSRLGDALEAVVRHDLSMVPIVDVDGKLVNVFSHRSDAAKYLLGFDPTPFWGTLLRLDDIADMHGMKRLDDAGDLIGEEGEFRISVAGCDTWKRQVTHRDTIVCSHPKVLEDVPDARLPRAVVVLSEDNLHGTKSVSRLHRNSTIVLQYSGTLVELIQQLTLRISLASLNLPDATSLGFLDKVDDVQSIVRDQHHAVPVVDEDGFLQGVVSTGDLSQTDGRTAKVVLVDHFEMHQSVSGLETADVLEVLDHHRVGDVQTHQPIRVYCAPVGSASTLVASCFFEHQMDMKPSTAMLLLAGLCADTLVLRGPTSTDMDHEVAVRLAEIADVNLHDFGLEVLMAADDLLTADPKEIWNRDQKQFHVRNRHFSVAQLETSSLEKLPGQLLDDFECLVHEDRAQRGDVASVLVVTDVLKGDSIIFGAEQANGEVVRRSFGTARKDGWIEAAGVVSRKKQVVPALMKSIAVST